MPHISKRLLFRSSTFIMELNGYDKRVTILFTSILTLMGADLDLIQSKSPCLFTAFSVYLGENLPKLAYLTAMHELIVASYVMLVLAVIFVSVEWIIIQDACSAADEDLNGETTHQELENFCRFDAPDLTLQLSFVFYSTVS